ncbi:CAP domain-containing protein [Deinococcus hohokamensis]|uniref:CAP domain-containing protein n=1 Tax=Deinococcus hohokamensis TaxID=309883 RepID=A0ABV9IAU2_9DEIO
MTNPLFHPGLGVQALGLCALLTLSACAGTTGSSPAPTTPSPITPTPAPAPTPSPTPAPSGIAQRVLDLTNAARAQARTCGGTAYSPAPALSLNAQLTQAAQGHAADMAARNYFSHTSLDGRTMADRVEATGYRWSTIGENIAAGQTSPEEVVSGWLNSPGHCANIMNPAFRELGVGYAQGGNYGHDWVQDFGTAR